jgi:hypothetical protein
MKPSYQYTKELKIKGDVLARLSTFFERGTKHSVVKHARDNGDFEFTFFVEDTIQDQLLALSLKFVIANERVKETLITLESNNDRVNEYHLKNYLIEMYNEVLLSEHNDELKNYIIRTYSRLFNASQIQGEFEINIGRRVLIKPNPSMRRDECLTEHVVMFDIDVSAVNIEQARSVAFNTTRDVNALLSLLLDVGFEPLTSEFRNFIILRPEAPSSARFRTGYLDQELGLVVKDNLNGLKHLEDVLNASSPLSGKISFRLADDGTGKMGDEVVFDAGSQDKIARTFENRSTKRKKNNVPLYREDITRARHFMNESISIPRSIRTYFKNYSSLDNIKKKEAFIASARMYNIALTVGRDEPTLSAAYMICAIEALATCHGLSFSDFLIRFSEGGAINKKLTDYFYGSIRSSHFHSGKFFFNENSINLQVEFDTLLREKQDDYFAFYSTLRGAMVTWINREILSLSNAQPE